MDLVEEVYKATRELPKEELYGLASQLRRAVVSIPSNIAEGQGRATNKQFQQFLSFAHGSLREVETQLMISQRLSYLSGETLEELPTQSAEVGRLVQGLINSLENR